MVAAPGRRSATLGYHTLDCTPDGSCWAAGGGGRVARLRYSTVRYWPGVPPDPAEQLALAEPMRSRRSTSVFDDSHVLSDDEIELLLRAAQWAPSWGNLQPAVFVVAAAEGPRTPCSSRA